MSIAKGANIVEQPGPFSWSRSDGVRRTVVYEGTHSAIEAYYSTVRNSLNPDAIEIDRDVNNGTSRMTVLFNFDETEIPEIGVINWELISNDLTKDLYEHSKVLDFPAAVLSAVRKAVDQFENQTADDEYTVAQATIDITAACVTAGYSSANPIAVFNLRAKGQDSFSVDQSVLRKTQLVSSNYPQKLAFSGVGKLWTGSQINAQESIPIGIQFDINQIEAPPARTGYLWSWLKKRPTAIVVSRNKIQLVQEWWLEQWSTFVYDTF